MVTLTLGGWAQAASAATLPPGFTETPISGLSSPTAMAIAPDGRIFVCEKGGALRVIKNGALLPTPFVSLAVDDFSERGLLGVAFDPAFTTNGFVYLYYTATGPIRNRVSRFTASGDTAQPGSELPLLNLPVGGAGNHNGGAIHFGPDGKLYVAVGEHADPFKSQDLASPLGKILRINPNGSFPADNPFFNTPGAYQGIWALGLRNPFTFAFNGSSSQVFINDVGGSLFEEINDGAPGANYGWPGFEGPTNPPGITAPFHFYANDAGTCALTGGAFYSPTVSAFPGDYAGDYFFSDFCGGWIDRIDVATKNVTRFATGINLPVDIQVGADGSLYYLSLGAGAVYRVQYPSSPPVDPALSVLTDGLSFRLSWTASAGATAYQIEAGSQRGAANLLNINVGANRVLEGLVGAGTYFVRVRAIGPSGTSGPSNEVVWLAGTVACAKPPPPPTGYTAQTAGINVLLSWNRSLAATSYVLEAGSMPGGVDQLIANVGNVASLTATAPPNTYFTRLRGVNACGTSAPSAEVPVTLSCNVAAPSGLVATKTGAIVKFTWNGSPGATGYRALVGTQPGASNVLDVQLGAGTSVSVSSAGVPPGTYHVRIVATTSCGSSGPSNEVPVSVP